MTCTAMVTDSCSMCSYPAASRGSSPRENSRRADCCDSMMAASMVCTCRGVISTAICVRQGKVRRASTRPSMCTGWWGSYMDTVTRCASVIPATAGVGGTVPFPLHTSITACAQGDTGVVMRCAAISTRGGDMVIIEALSGADGAGA